jgi:dihydrofolate reductase
MHAGRRHDAVAMTGGTGIRHRASAPYPMLPEARVFIATSLDGQIARADGALDWLPAPVAGEDHGYAEFMAGIDALVMGRHTFETVLGFGDWPYGALPVRVLSRRPVALPPGLPHNVRAAGGDPVDVLRGLGELGARAVYVDGGDTIRRFLAAGLVTRMTITRVPVLIGRGIPLFDALPADQRWTLVRARHWLNGLSQAEYARDPG